MKYLNNNEQSAIEELIQLVKSFFNVKKIILFGSKARGDFNLDSDIDLVIITEEKRTAENRWKISDLEFEINVKYNVSLSCRFYNVDDWLAGDKVSQTFYVEIMKDGIELI